MSLLPVTLPFELLPLLLARLADAVTEAAEEGGTTLDFADKEDAEEEANALLAATFGLADAEFTAEFSES